MSIANREENRYSGRAAMTSGSGKLCCVKSPATEISLITFLSLVFFFWYSFWLTVGNLHFP
jgi:hypothetical protein